MAQQLMTGADATAARQETARANAARALAACLRMTVNALRAYYEACEVAPRAIDLQDERGSRMQRHLLQYAYFLEMLHGGERRGGA